MITTCIICGVMILLFLGLGFLFARGKGQGLIAGWNTMSEKERARYDEKKLMKIVRNGMFVFAGCVAVSLIGTLADSRLLTDVGFAVLFVAAIVLVIRANTAAKH